LSVTSQRRRTHPSDVIFQALGSLRELLLPLVVAAVIGAGGGGGPGFVVVFGVLGILGSLVVGIVRWRATTYVVDDRAVSVRTGVFSPDETVVPIQRISAVDTVAGPLQRLLGVVELQIQVAGSAEPEIRLRPLARHDAEAVAAALGHPGATLREPDWRLGRRRLLLAALSAPQLGILAPLLAGGGAVAQQVFQSGDRDRILDLLPDTPMGLLAGGAGVLVAAGLLAIAGAVVAFAGFEVLVDGDRLRVRRGLLRRQASTVPRSRVHAVRLVESPLHQPFGLLRVRMETGGYGARGGASSTLLPVVHRRDVRAVLARLVPELADDGHGLERPPRRARRRYVLTPAATALAGAVVLVVLVPDAWPAGAALVAVAVAAGLLRHADAGWALREERVLVRARRLGRSTLVARRARLQQHAVSRTPLQRRARLAGVAIAVGSGAVGRIDHLEGATAEGLLSALRRPSS
jgi:putative membrane protein